MKPAKAEGSTPTYTTSRVLTKHDLSTRSVDSVFERTSSRAASGAKPAKAEGSRPTYTTSCVLTKHDLLICFRTDQRTCSFWCETGQGGRLEADSHDTLCPNETRSVDPCFERTSSRAASGVKAAKAEGSRPTHTTPSDSRRREIHQSHVIRLIHLEELHAITTDPRPARRNPHNQTGDCNSHQKEDERRRR